MRRSAIALATLFVLPAATIHAQITDPEGPPTLVVAPFELAIPRTRLVHVERDRAGGFPRYPTPSGIPVSAASVEDAAFTRDPGVGAAVADLLVERLLAGGRARVVDRTTYEQQMARQNGSPSDTVSPALAAARRLGVRYAVVGSIVALGTDERQAGAAGTGGLPTIGGFLVKRRKTRATLSARVVQVETGLVVASVSAEGRSGKGGSIAAGGVGGGIGGILGQSSDEETAAAAQAIARAVDALAAELNRRIGH